MFEDEIKEVRSNPEKAECYFSKKLAFSLGPVELKDLSGEQNVKIIDVRNRADYEIGHIPQAISIPYEELSEKMKELKKDCMETGISCSYYYKIGGGFEE